MSKARSNASSGYRCKIWSQDGEIFNEALMCTHCSLLLKAPVQTSETGKRYCKECFDIVRYVSISIRSRESPVLEKGRDWPPLNKVAGGGFHLLYQFYQLGTAWGHIRMNACEA